MNHKEASAILIKLLDKPGLSPEEKEALSTAVGVLAWTSLAQSRVQSLKAKRDAEKKHT